MIVGNVVALQQKNIKRMLAYSSIVHSGYLLVAVLAATSLASMAFTFYVLAYTPLKPVTPLNTLASAICGATPPMMA